MSPDLLLEICVDCPESIKNAIDGGADRLELCSALSEGGLTPTLGLAKLAKLVSSAVPIFAMIRIRGGNFVYTQQETNAMIDDLKDLKKIGVDGFVFGALTKDNALDVSACEKIVEAARPLPVTFHRAFDEVKNPVSSLSRIRELGFSRILTSGQKKSALEGADTIAKLVKISGDDLVVMPGAGINEDNIEEIKETTGAKEFHGSAKRASMGIEAGVTITDLETVRKMKLALERGKSRSQN